MRSGHAEMVAMTRQHISDPETVNKLMAGRREDVRGCIACNQGCLDMLFKAAAVTCVHNPAAGYEAELGLGTLTRAARRQARRRGRRRPGRPEGRRDRQAARPRRDAVRAPAPSSAASSGSPPRSRDARTWARRSAGSATARAARRRRAAGRDGDARRVLALEPDAVVVATGSAPTRELIGNKSFGIWEVPGLDAEHVLSVWDVLEDDAAVGRHGAGRRRRRGQLEGASVALQLAGRGHAVRLATTLPYVGAGARPLLDRSVHADGLLLGIVTHPFAIVQAVTETTVELLREDRPATLDGVDSVVLCGWHEPVQRPLLRASGRGAWTCTRAGDAVAARTILHAVHEGERIARAI